ncbi:hypothetical protein A3K89_21470 [Rhodococcoides kyotonense]|uniref:Uncharacterized protein n=1 Tax=Rhodococcoides kyotonense TaxID=398843 RepID=A0A177YEX8_9NOCA|nr:hypothetical protein A3K89_21470 [Rhodococcus kyotonensis]
MIAGEDEEALAPLDETIGDTAADVLPPEFADPDNLPAFATVAGVDAATPSIPLGSDADYLASLDALDAPMEYDDAPPPEYDGYDSEPEVVEPDGDEAGEVDPYAAMLEHARVLVLPYPTVTADERVRLLTADVDAAKAEQQALRARIADGTSPTLLNAAAMLDELQERADRQRPARIAMLDARQDWMDTEFEAESLWHRIDTVVRPAVAADVAAAGDDDDARALAARGLDWEIWRAGFADDAATAARTHAQEAAAEYERVTAADGGEVTAVDVTTARLAAESVDLATLAELKADVDRTEAMLWRAEQAAMRAAVTDTVIPSTRVQPSVEVVDAPEVETVEHLEHEAPAPTELVVEDAPETAAVPRPVLSPADAALLAKMEQDPIRLVPDAELAAFVDRAGRGRAEPTVVADTEKLYARLDEQAAAIAAARELAAELRRVTAQYEAARSEHTMLTEQLSAAKRRERKTLKPAAADARLREERLARQVQDTQRAAHDAAGRVQADTSEWPAIVHRATDPDRRSADLAAATVFDSAVSERNRRSRTMWVGGRQADAERRARAAANAPQRLDAPAISGITDRKSNAGTPPVDLDQRPRALVSPTKTVKPGANSDRGVGHGPLDAGIEPHRSNDLEQGL